MVVEMDRASTVDSDVLPVKVVAYVMDAYCGWCWGVSERMREFEAMNRDRVAFAAISGGLFVGERAKPISSYPHIPQANERITRLTGAVFGSEYQALLKQGTLVMDSLDAGAALAALRTQAPERAVHWAHELQAAFYGRGRSLSDRTTISEIAACNGLDESLVLRHLEDGSAKARAEADFKLARRLGADSYPTLLFLNGNAVERVPITGMPLSKMNELLSAMLG